MREGEEATSAETGGSSELLALVRPHRPVLRRLEQGPGIVVPSHELERAGWPGRSLSYQRLGRCIGDLRKQIGPTWIHTIPGEGYLLVPGAPTVGDDQVLSRNEALLRRLLEEPGVVVSREALARAAWPHANVRPSTVARHMSELRLDLGPDRIRIVPSRPSRPGGYVLKPEPVVVEHGTTLSPTEAAAVRGFLRSDSPESWIREQGPKPVRPARHLLRRQPFDWHATFCRQQLLVAQARMALRADDVLNVVAKVEARLTWVRLEGSLWWYDGDPLVLVFGARPGGGCLLLAAGERDEAIRQGRRFVDGMTDRRRLPLRRRSVLWKGPSWDAYADAVKKLRERWHAERLTLKAPPGWQPDGAVGMAEQLVAVTLGEEQLLVVTGPERDSREWLPAADEVRQLAEHLRPTRTLPSL